MPALTIGFCPHTRTEAHSRTRRRSAGCSPRCLVAISLAVAALASLPVARADVSIDTAVTTAQQGDGGAFTVTSDGSINTASNDGITAGSDTAITTLTVNGPVTGQKTGVLNDNSTIDEITNSSAITGTDEHGIVARNGGAITTLTNNAAGTITGPFRGIYALNANTSFGTITNSGTITGTGQAGIQLDQGATITKITNSGTIRGDRGIWQNAISAANQGEITEVENLSGGLISGDVQWGYDNNGYTGTITNHDNATIYGLRAGIVGFENDVLDLIDNKAGARSKAARAAPESFSSPPAVSSRW
jgi:hypothetical protein